MVTESGRSGKPSGEVRSDLRSRRPPCIRTPVRLAQGGRRIRRSRLPALAVVGVAAGVLAAGTAADASPAAGVWPGAVITVADGTGGHGYHAALAAAVRAWNRAAVGVRFVLGGGAGAEVRVVYQPGACLAGRAGSAPFGFAPAAATVVVRSCPAVVRPLLVAHELGRVLGLPADDRTCSLMNGRGLSDGAHIAVPARCSPYLPPSWLPDLVDPGSVAVARALYRSPAGPEQVVLGGAEAPRIAWRLPRGSGAQWDVVARGEGRCPTEFDLADGGAAVIYRKAAFAGLHWVVDAAFPAARALYCYGVFTVSASGRATRHPGFVSFTYDRPPAAAFAFSPPQPTVGQAVSFADHSTDPDGTVVHWHWDFGDPASGSADVLDTSDPAAGQRPQHVYAAGGTYTVTLTVTDDGGKQGSVAAQVAVAG
jgi:hypothetical protein